MTDLVTLNLHEVFRDAAQLGKLHEIQQSRLAERIITGGNRPKGMRLSIPDPVRRVKAALDPFWAVNLDEGLGERGYMCEDLLEVALFHGTYPVLGGKQYVAQAPVQWHEHGQTAFDWLAVGHASTDRPISCKSSIRSVKPSAANIAQEMRMMALAGYPAGSEFEVWVIDPSALRAVGPYVHALTQDAIDEARVEFGKVSAAYSHFAALDEPTEDAAWNDPEAWRSTWGLRSTSGAFRFATLDASAAIEKRVRGFMRARHALTTAKREEETAKALIRPHVEEQIALARREDPDARRVTAHGGDLVVTFSITTNGVMRVDERPAESDAASVAA